MARNLGVVVVLLAIVAGVLWLLGGPAKIFGGRGSDSATDGDGSRDASGRDATGGMGGSSEAGVSEDGRPRGAILFGRPREERKGTGALSGRVVRFADQQALSGGTVVLSGTDHAGKDVKVEVATDSTGAFVFPVVAAGDGYVLRIDARGESPFVLPDVEVRAGATKELGTLYLGAAGALAGQVIDHEGRAVGNAEVRVFTGYGSLMDIIGNLAEMFTMLDREPTPLARGRADADGRFKVEGLSPGPIVVRASVPGKRAGIAKARMTPEGPSGGPVVVRIEPGAVLAGVVVDEAGRPVPRATIAFMVSGSMDIGAVMFGRVFTTTDEAGAFRAYVDENETKIQAMVVAEGFPRTVSQALVPGRDDLRIVLKAGVEVEVTVLEAKTRAPVAGASVMVAASDTGNMMGSSMDPESDELAGYLTGTTNAAGVATFLCRPGVLEMVMATAPGHAMVMTGASMDAATAGAAGAFFGGSDGPLEKEIRAGKPNRIRLLMAKGVTLTGRVLDPQKRGIAGAEVKSMAFGAIMGGGVSGRADADGAYRIEGVPTMNGQALVFAKAPGWITKMSSMEGVKVPEGATEATHDFTLYPGATVRGRVVDAAGKGVAGAEVTFEGAGMGFEGLLFGNQSAVTGTDGAYVLFDLEEGKVPEKTEGAEPAMPANPFTGAGATGPRVRASAAGYVGGTSEPFEVGAGASVTAPTIKLSRGVTVKGRVTEPGGKPIAGAVIDVAYETGGSMFEELLGMGGGGSGTKTVRSGSDGSFQVETVPPGTATFTAKAAGWATSRASVKVEGETEPAAFDLEMRPAREIRGRVTGPDGSAVKGASVSVDGGNDAETADAYVASVSTKSDGDGAFVLKGLPPGKHTVRVTASGFKRFSGTAEAGSTLDARLSPPTAGGKERIAEIQTEIGEISMKFMSAKGADREALQRRMMELMQEQKDLQKDEAPAMD
jgi:protocatechuate 3,4-dioxygenase beta subunit